MRAMASLTVNASCFPERVFLERGVFQQSVNCEFRFHSDSSEPLDLLEVSVDGFDKGNTILFKLPLNNFGLSPPILTIPERKLEQSKMLEIFNPLPNFPLDYHICKLHYQFKFMSAKGGRAKPELTLRPMVYEQKASLILPFTGTSLVTEGHDFLTHHRRNFPFTHPLIQQIGITGNSSRFAYDFVLLDDELKMSKEAPKSNEDFFCWAKPVLCPEDGSVGGMANDMPDNEFYRSPEFDVEAHTKEPEASMLKHFGNYVLIDHGNDEFSVLGHMLRGSVQVHKGDKVVKGQTIGKIGTSGDSIFPHIHYQVQDGTSMLKSEGLPSKFESFGLIIGNVTRKIVNLCPNTGMIIRS